MLNVKTSRCHLNTFAVSRCTSLLSLSSSGPMAPTGSKLSRLEVNVVPSEGIERSHPFVVFILLSSTMLRFVCISTAVRVFLHLHSCPSLQKTDAKNLTVCSGSSQCG